MVSRTEEKGRRGGCMLSVVSIAFLILTIALMLAFSGCTTTKYVPVEHHTTDTVYQSKLHRNSIYLHDSIRVSEKGDTIRIGRWRARHIELTTHDTIYQANPRHHPWTLPLRESWCPGSAARWVGADHRRHCRPDGYHRVDCLEAEEIPHRE